MINRLYLLIALVLLVLTSSVVIVQTLRLASMRTEFAGYRTNVAAERTAQARAAAEQTERFRAIEARYQEAQHATDLKTARLAEAERLARAAADVAHGRLRDAARAVAARCDSAPTDSPHVTSGATTASAADLLADLLGRIDEAAGELATVADKRYIAGLACQFERDALTTIRGNDQQGVSPQSETRNFGTQPPVVPQ